MSPTNKRASGKPGAKARTTGAAKTRARPKATAKAKAGATATATAKAPIRATPAPERLDAQVEPAPAPKPSGPAFPVEIDPRKVEETLQKLRGELVHWANKGRYTRVRFKFRGKQLLPDIPLAAVVAAEGLSFAWAGLLRALVVNLAGGALLTVELVNDSMKRIQEGREALLAGDVDLALERFRRAAAMDRDNPSAQLNIGVALKLKGDVTGARAALERARQLDPQGDVGAEAERILATLPAAPASSETAVSVTRSEPPVR